MSQWLKSLGVRDITVRTNPPGRGSGERYVLQQYPHEVLAVRRTNQYRPVGIGLVTIIDADTLTVEQRHRELNRRLDAAQVGRRRDDDKIAILVPKRNIETWIHYLRGVLVDEETLYPKLVEPGSCKSDVKRFVEESQDAYTFAPPSLQLALAEMERIV